MKWAYIILKFTKECLTAPINWYCWKVIHLVECLIWRKKLSGDFAHLTGSCAFSDEMIKAKTNENTSLKNLGAYLEKFQYRKHNFPKLLLRENILLCNIMSQFLTSKIFKETLSVQILHQSTQKYKMFTTIANSAFLTHTKLNSPNLLPQLSTNLSLIFSVK